MRIVARSRMSGRSPFIKQTLTAALPRCSALPRNRDRSGRSSSRILWSFLAHADISLLARLIGTTDRRRNSEKKRTWGELPLVVTSGVSQAQSPETAATQNVLTDNPVFHAHPERREKACGRYGSCNRVGADRSKQQAAEHASPGAPKISGHC